MRTVTREERIGEDMGPVDWSHPMIAEMIATGWRAPLVEQLRQVEQNPSAFEGTTDGGQPRCGWDEVLAVRMYDGWPYWQPTPSVLLKSWAGVSWHSFHAMSELRLREDK